MEQRRALRVHVGQFGSEGHSNTVFGGNAVRLMPSSPERLLKIYLFFIVVVVPVETGEKV